MLRETPGGNDAEHVDPQSMPAGVEVTLPVPVPFFEMVSVGATSVNAASTVVLEFIGNVQVPVPLHPPPDQPVKVEPADAAAVSVTLVPVENACEQLVPQSMPAGAEVTLPPPVPLLDTLSCDVVPGAWTPCPAAPTGF